MDKVKSWIKEIIPLDRPEYAKQPEALLTDLLWRSEGSQISNEIKLTRESKLIRLVPTRMQGGKHSVIETMPVAQETDVASLIQGADSLSSPVRALIASMLAPKSRGDKSSACVPIHPEAIAFQTLHGLVNKLQPPNLAGVIETVGWLGGSGGFGRVAQVFLQGMQQKTDVEQGLPGLVDYLLPMIAKQTWTKLTTQYPDNSVPATWPSVKPADIDTSLGQALFAATCQLTPFHWFWNKWATLCRPDKLWFDTLPTRRFIDWATCLLRTGLSFSYLWEANFFIKVQACLAEELFNRKGQENPRTEAMDALRSMLKQGAILATIESSTVPTTQKHVWNSLSNMLARGYLIRRSFEEHLQHDNFGVPESASNIETIIQSWMHSLQTPDLEELSEPPKVDSNTAPNLREFVRYLLRPRSSDDDTRDQADFYYLARSNTRSFWFQPGPEWLVVITSLIGQHPGSICTLGMLMDDLRMLGLKVERRTVVEMLEEAGLSTDSPDADNALVIQSGF